MNPFEQLANSQLTAAAKRRHKDTERRASKSIVMSDADAPMKGMPMEEARDARSQQMAGYRRHKANERDDLCQGQYRREMTALVRLLKTLDMDSADRLTADIMAASWLKAADLDTRHAVLSMIADAILKLRVRNGMAPFDDAISDEPPTAFQVIRKEMTGV